MAVVEATAILDAVLLLPARPPAQSDVFSSHDRVAADARVLNANGVSAGSILAAMQGYKYGRKNEMRTTLDLIQELEMEAKNCVHLRLVVCFEDYTVLIGASDPNRIAKLSDAIRQGGTPIGVVGIIAAGTEELPYSRALAEFSDQEYVEPFLRRAQDCLADIWRRMHKLTGGLADKAN